MSAALLAALGQSLPKGLAMAGAAEKQGLWPGEAVPKATPARLREFAAGRSAARAAMQALGHPPSAVPMQADRSPSWPEAVTGSISHCDGACLALLGWRRDWAGIGLDLEPATPLEAALWPEILGQAEQSAVMALPKAERGLAALQIFMAKEAVYKAQYPISGQLFGFDGLNIVLQKGGFVARFTAGVSPFVAGQMMTGRFVMAQGLIAAHCLITRQ